MDYSKLAAEFLNSMATVRKAGHQKCIDKSLQGEAYALCYIALSDGEVNPGEISQMANVSTARVATTLNNLEKKGLITRKIDPNIRNRIIVEITEEGKQAAYEDYKAVLEITTKMLEFLGEHDAKEYVRITEKLAQLPFQE